MKQVTTKYYCDRCGAEIEPINSNEIERGHGVIAFCENRKEPNPLVFASCNDWTPDASDSRCAMLLCKKCLNSVALFLMNKAKERK